MHYFCKNRFYWAYYFPFIHLHYTLIHIYSKLRNYKTCVVLLYCKDIPNTYLFEISMYLFILHIRKARFTLLQKEMSSQFINPRSNDSILQSKDEMLMLYRCSHRHHHHQVAFAIATVIIWYTASPSSFL